MSDTLLVALGGLGTVITAGIVAVIAARSQAVKVKAEAESSIGETWSKITTALHEDLATLRTRLTTLELKYDVDVKALRDTCSALQLKVELLEKENSALRLLLTESKGKEKQT